MEVGEKIDNYVITEVLAGGMSEVYRVFDGSDRYVLKVVMADTYHSDRSYYVIR